jgi:hypothetical protein
MIIDEVSMLDCKVMESLHSQLAKAKSKPEITFGSVNIIFLSDFLQLPAIINPDLFVNQNNWGFGHRLWRSLKFKHHRNIDSTDETGARSRVGIEPSQPSPEPARPS